MMRSTVYGSLIFRLLNLHTTTTTSTMHSTPENDANTLASLPSRPERTVGPNSTTSYPTVIKRPALSDERISLMPWYTINKFYPDSAQPSASEICWAESCTRSDTKPDKHIPKQVEASVTSESGKRETKAGSLNSPKSEPKTKVNLGTAIRTGDLFSQGYMIAPWVLRPHLHDECRSRILGLPPAHTSGNSKQGAGFSIGAMSGISLEKSE